MSPQARCSLNEWVAWLSRGLIIFILYNVNAKLDRIPEIEKTQEVLKEKVQNQELKMAEVIRQQNEMRSLLTHIQIMQTKDNAQFMENNKP